MPFPYQPYVYVDQMVGKGGSPTPTPTPTPTPGLARVMNQDYVRTWYNEPTILVDSGAMYMGGVTANGSVTLTKSTSLVDSVSTLTRTLEIDDHNDAGSIKLPGGRLFSAYSAHGIENNVRYRISTNALPNVSAFDPVQLISNGSTPTSYALSSLLNDNNVRVYFRSGGAGDTARPRKVAKATVANILAGTPGWVLTTVFAAATGRPYVSQYSDGVTTDYFLVSSGHPDEVATQVGYVRMTLVGGVEKYYDTFDNELTLPIDPTTLTPIGGAGGPGSTTGGRCWNDKIYIGADGQPRVIFWKFPTGTTGSNGSIIYTNAEYWHGRRNPNGTWTCFKLPLAGGQRSVYIGQSYYLGGVDFDSQDPTILYVAETINNIYEQKKYQFNETTGALTLLDTITSGSTTHNFRGRSPRGASRPFDHTYIDKTYTTYNSYSTAVNGYGPAPAAFDPTLMFAAGEVGAILDLTDYSKMFQDAAGTVPVTGTGQPVRIVRDKRGSGADLILSAGITLEVDGSGKNYLNVTGAVSGTMALNLSGVDALSITTALTKTSDAATGVFMEYSVSSTSNNGTFAVFAPSGAGLQTVSFRCRGASDSIVVSDASYPAGTKITVSFGGEINGGIDEIRVNSGAPKNNFQVNSGNFGNFTLYFFQRSGGTNQFNGRMYSMIIRSLRNGSLSYSGAEAWVNAR